MENLSKKCLNALPRLTETYVENYIDSRSYHRSTNYIDHVLYESSEIHDDGIIEIITELPARSTGQGYYNVNIKFNDEGIVSCECNCPVGYRCKHICASLRKIIRDKENLRFLRKRKRDVIDLTKSSSEEDDEDEDEEEEEEDVLPLKKRRRIEFASGGDISINSEELNEIYEDEERLCNLVKFLVSRDVNILSEIGRFVSNEDSVVSLFQNDDENNHFDISIVRKNIMDCFSENKWNLGTRGDSGDILYRPGRGDNFEDIASNLMNHLNKILNTATICFNDEDYINAYLLVDCLRKDANQHAFDRNGDYDYQSRGYDEFENFINNVDQLWNRIEDCMEEEDSNKAKEIIKFHEQHEFIFNC